MIKIIVLTLFFLLIFGDNYLLGQKIASDSNGESVFSNYSFDDYKIDISTDEPFSIGFSKSRLFNSFSKIRTTSDKNKDQDFYFNYGLLNSGAQLDFSKLNKNKFGHSFKIGFQSSVTSLKNLNTTLFGRGGLGLSVFYNIDNFDYYNSETKTEGTSNPISYGVEINGTFFPKVIENFEKVIFISAFDVKYFIKTWNNNVLKNYQSNDNFTLNDDSTIVILEDFKGKYGVLDDNISRLRLVLSEPIFFRRVNLTPYVVTNLTSNNKPLYIIGANFNFIQAAINRQELNFDSTFGIGLDYVYHDSEWNKPTIFLRGSLNLGKY